MTYFYWFVLQSETSQLTASFKYSDKESGVDHIKLEIFEMFHGTRTQKYPGNYHYLVMWFQCKKFKKPNSSTI